MVVAKETHKQREIYSQSIYLSYIILIVHLKYRQHLFYLQRVKRIDFFSLSSSKISYI